MLHTPGPGTQWKLWHSPMIPASYGCSGLIRMAGHCCHACGFVVKWREHDAALWM